MLKVSRILKRARLYGWIKDDGSYHEVPSEQHASWSARELGIKWNREFEDYTHAFDAGWIRVNWEGASCNAWDNDTFKKLQMVLLRQGESGSRDYYLDIGNDVWSHEQGLVTSIDEIKEAKNLASLPKLPVGV